MNNYEPSLPSDPGFPPEVYGDFGSETVAWLVGDDNSMGFGNRSSLQENMSPHDMLRSVLGEGRSDEEIEQALGMCGYDLSSTLAMLMEQHGNSATNQTTENSTVIGKSTMPVPVPTARPVTPRNGVVCRFFLSTGQCLRADCRFSHDLGTTICKYWLMGSCLAGETCIFSHDPTMSVSKMTIDNNNNSRNSTPPPQLQFHDSTAFPALASDQWGAMGSVLGAGINPPPGFKLPISRPNSRQQSRERERSSTPVPAVDDTDAFPSLSSSAKASGNGKKRRNNRSDGGNIPTGPSSLADVVRATPSPSPHSNRTSTSSGASSNRWSGVGSSPSSKRSSRVSAAHIPAPQQIPWMETGSALNRVYLKHRKEALAHGVLRAKYLQQANSAWQRNDAKSAKEHSRKANNENIAMMKAHKEASKAIYEERNKGASSSTELFVDLHG